MQRPSFHYPIFVWLQTLGHCVTTMQVAWVGRKYSVLDMMSPFEMLKNGMPRQGDGLTKHIFHNSLIQFLNDGMWTLVDDPTFTSAKK